MKTRMGFVSNSSSSSFIIALNNTAPCPHCGRQDYNIINLIENQRHNSYYDEDTKVQAIGAEKIKEEFKDYPTYYPNQKWPEIFKKLDKLEKQGKQVAYVSVSYHDEVVNNELKIQIDNKSITKIWCDHDR